VTSGGSGGSSPRESTAGPNDPWYSCLPSCVTRVPCGQGRHTVRWEAGELGLPEHPDAEGELVLAALGGEKAGCIELAQAWGRHTNDLSVLAIGPRGLGVPADEIAVSWDDVASAARSAPLGGPRMHGTVPTSARLGRLASRPPALPGQVAARHRQVQEEMERSRRRTTDMLSLLALGYGVKVRLVGQVAAAYADRLDDQADGGATEEGGVSVRPALVAAIAGRLAPVAEKWLGIDPDQVVVSLPSGPGWGSAELTGHGEERRLRVALPAGWLSSVWACGLALVGRHLVVAVERPGWPHAGVLGLRSPGAEPEPLDVHAAQDGPADAPHWEL
jgi:hypothetical protein